MKVYFYDIAKCHLAIGDLEDYQSEEIIELYIKSGDYSYSQNKDNLEYIGLCLSDVKCFFSNNILIYLITFLAKCVNERYAVNEYFKITYKDNSSLSLTVRGNETRIKLHYENTITDEEIVTCYDINDFYDVFVMYCIRSMFYGVGGTYDKTGRDILIHPDDEFPKPINNDHKVEMLSTINDSCIEDLYSYYSKVFSKLDELDIKHEKISKDDFETIIKCYKQTSVIELWNDFNIPTHVGITICLLDQTKLKVGIAKHILTIVNYKDWLKKLKNV